jgi:hypothetical protein
MTDCCSIIPQSVLDRLAANETLSDSTRQAMQEAAS